MIPFFLSILLVQQLFFFATFGNIFRDIHITFFLYYFVNIHFEYYLCLILQLLCFFRYIFFSIIVIFIHLNLISPLLLFLIYFFFLCNFINFIKMCMCLYVCFCCESSICCWPYVLWIKFVFDSLAQTEIIWLHSIIIAMKLVVKNNN